MSLSFNQLIMLKSPFSHVPSVREKENTYAIHRWKIMVIEPSIELSYHSLKH